MLRNHRISPVRTVGPNAFAKPAPGRVTQCLGAPHYVSLYIIVFRCTSLCVVVRCALLAFRIGIPGPIQVLGPLFSLRFTHVEAVQANPILG